ncbi:unnamed protein product [Adineta steineri]|uniref:RING-type domain-containing protein n=1 Tax=Adineta steineri TaxID=433720 RepID=A0A818I3W5_9BILA|nr:unnamed protein product [Adineta steineri]CAF3519345.1 unnamed protein product [Adineta steineri]
MADKQKRFMNYSSFQRTVDEQNHEIDSHSRRLIPITTTAAEHLPSSTIMSQKRQYSSTKNDQSDLFSNNHHLIYNSNILPIAITTSSRKRPAQDNSYIQEHNEHVNKRIRYDQTNNIELENQPPRATIKRRSLFLYHQGQDWNNLQIQNDIPPSTRQINNVSSYEYEQNRSNYFSPCDLHTEHLPNQHLYMFGNDALMTSTHKNTFPKSSMNMFKNNVRLLSPQFNVTSPLRTTNFVLDSKQQTMSATILRTGNISPAHSDTSTESTSTCSSDEQQFHQNFPSFHYQPSRSYRERENYEQLLDLAEKLSDPNRLNTVDIEQFISYRYKTITTTDTSLSKQTDCVICMSQFRNSQRIRVLPCQHEYHSKCISRWFTMNSSCPICRRDNFLSSC